MEKAAYLSDSWFVLLEREARHAIGDAAREGLARDFVLVERYSAGPELGFGEGLMPGFRLTFTAKGDAQVRPGAAVDEQADCVIAMDWHSACRVVSEPSGPALEALLQDLCAQGLATIAGDIWACPVNIDKFHDAVVMGTQVPIDVNG